MDAISWILLILVVVCAVALIIISKKRKELERKIALEEDFGGSSGRIPEPEEEIPNPQVTIYAYHAPSKKHICAMCGGENDTAAVSCYICGRALK